MVAYGMFEEVFDIITYGLCGVQSLTTLTNEQIVAELGWTRKAIKAALGVTPVTMRPPRGDIGSFHSLYLQFSILSINLDDRVRAISLAMGLLPVIWTSTPDGGKFDSNGTFTKLAHLHLLIKFALDWRVADNSVTAQKSFDIYGDIMKNASNIPTGCVALSAS